MQKNLLLITFFSSLFVDQTHAYVITLDPSQFAAGTEVSNAYGGVTLSSASLHQLDPTLPSELYLGSVYVTDCSGCKPQVEGTRVFSGSASTTGNPSWAYELSFARNYRTKANSSEGTILMATFDHPTDYVQVIGSGATNFTPFGVDYWDIGGNWLGRCGMGNDADNVCSNDIILTSMDPYPTHYSDQRILTIALDNPLIAFITAGGSDGPGYVSQISYNNITVSEPSSIAMVGTSLALFTEARRKRKKRDA